MRRAAALEAVREQVRPTILAEERRLPVLAALAPLLPGGGLRRGSAVAVDGPAATSLALALATGPSRDGAWVAAVGFPSLGLAAAAELGLALDRFVLVADPGDVGACHGRTASSRRGGPGAVQGAAGACHGGTARSEGGDVWPSVVAALVDAFEVVLVHASHRVRAADARRLAARCRERGAVLVRVGASGPTRAAWPEAPDVGLAVTRARWEGLGEGHGHLRARRVTVQATGRREAARPRRAELWLPSVDGTVEAVLPDPVPLHRPSPSTGMRETGEMREVVPT